MDSRLEERYVVIKLKHLTPEEENSLRQFIGYNGIQTIDCVVVEHDWKCYPQVVDLVLKEAEENKDGQ